MGARDHHRGMWVRPRSRAQIREPRGCATVTVDGHTESVCVPLEMQAPPGAAPPVGLEHASRPDRHPFECGRLLGIHAECHGGVRSGLRPKRACNPNQVGLS